MNQATVLKYLSALLNRQLVSESGITLTSGQRARLLSWLRDAGAYSREISQCVERPFTTIALCALLGEAGSSEGGERGISKAETGLGYARGVGGIGIDIQKIDELVPHEDAFDFRSSAEYSNIFSDREISYACAKQRPRETLAGLFAAKEAIVKADGGKAGVRLCEIEILPGLGGEPTHAGFELSVSHSGDYAIAVALRVPGRVASEAEAHSTPAGLSEPHATMNLGEQVTTCEPGQGRGSKLKWLVILIICVASLGMLCLRAWRFT